MFTLAELISGFDLGPPFGLYNGKSGKTAENEKVFLDLQSITELC